MSKSCLSCGGIIGIDCYNPQECAEIHRAMTSEYQSYGEMITDLLTRVGKIEQLLGMNRPLDIPVSIQAELHDRADRIDQLEARLEQARTLLSAVEHIVKNDNLFLADKIKDFLQ